MVEGIIFDVDGTILDSMMIWDEAPKLYLESQGCEVNENIGEITFDMTMAEGAQYMQKTYGLSLTEREIIDGINSRVYDFYAKKVQPKEGVSEFLEYVYSRGIPITIATSTERPMIEAALKRIGFDKYIKRIFTSTEIGKGKHYSDIFYAAINEMKSSVKNTWLMEDAVYSLETAKNIGLRTVGIYDFSSRDYQEDIKRLSDIYMKDWKEYKLLIEQMKF